MTPRLRRWAREHGFTYSRRTGWRRADGCFLDWNTSWGWRVHTPGCGFHPTEQPPAE